MTPTTKLRVVLCTLAAGLLAAPAFAAPAEHAFPACGDHGKGDSDGKKDVKKPKDGDADKKPAPSPAASELCGGDKGGKDVKKPKDEDHDGKKPPPSPA